MLGKTRDLLKGSGATIAVDAVGFSGAALIAWGFGMAWAPLGYIVGGLEMLAIAAVWASVRARAAKAPAETPAA